MWSSLIWETGRVELIWKIHQSRQWKVTLLWIMMKPEELNKSFISRIHQSRLYQNTVEFIHEVDAHSRWKWTSSLILSTNDHYNSHIQNHEHKQREDSCIGNFGEFLSSELWVLLHFLWLWQDQNIAFHRQMFPLTFQETFFFSRRMFPLAFLVFNLAYWVGYIYLLWSSQKYIWEVICRNVLFFLGNWEYNHSMRL